MRGTAEEWREQVGRLCSGNSRLVLAVSCAFAGPLLSIGGLESGGVHLHGGTSKGKTTTLFVAGSVCGGGGQNGFVQTWRTTTNGLEATAETHHDGTLFLDELAQVDARESAEVAYLLASGQGKSRMARSMVARKKPTWRLLFVSTGEVTLAEHAASAGKQVRGGADIRLLNIRADAGKGMGLIEELHGTDSSDIFIRQLREAAEKFYGAPFRSYLHRLVRERSAAEQTIRATREAINSVVPKASAGEVRRAADRFGVIAAAGELATIWNLTGWTEGEALEVAKRCFTEWLSERGTSGVRIWKPVSDRFVCFLARTVPAGSKN